MDIFTIIATPSLRAARMVYRMRATHNLREQLAMIERRIAIVERKIAKSGDNVSDDLVGVYGNLLAKAGEIEMEIKTIEGR